MEEERNQLEGKLEALIENLRQSIIVVEEFQPESQSTLHIKLNSIVDQLRTLNENSQFFSMEKVPVDVLEYNNTNLPLIVS